MAIDTIYQLRLVQTWGVGGKQLENVFFYDHTAGDGVAGDLGAAFEDLMLDKVNDLQTAHVKNVSLEIINLGNLGDFTSYILTGNGGWAGEVLPPYAAVGYTLKLNTRAVRRGSKRFSGVPESAGTEGKVTDPSYVTAIDAMRVALGAELITLTDTFKPVVLKRVRAEVAGTVPQQYTYRLPRTNLELIAGEVVNVVSSLNLSHQVSREV